MGAKHIHGSSRCCLWAGSAGGIVRDDTYADQHSTSKLPAFRKPRHKLASAHADVSPTYLSVTPRHKSNAGVFGAGVTGEGAFSMYEGRDIELDPAAPVTAVLSVAFIPPEGGGGDGAPKPCVSCFLVDDLPQNRRKGSRASVDGVPAVFMECASAKPEKVFLPGTCATAASTMNEPSDSGPSVKVPQQPLRRSTRASTVAHSKAAWKRARPQELSPPSTRAPLEDADTVFLVGDHPLTMARTTAWLQKSLGKEAVILGGISSCALVIGDQVRWRRSRRCTAGMCRPESLVFFGGISAYTLRARIVLLGRPDAREHTPCCLFKLLSCGAVCPWLHRCCLATRLVGHHRKAFPCRWSWALLCEECTHWPYRPKVSRVWVRCSEWTPRWTHTGLSSQRRGR